MPGGVKAMNILHRFSIRRINNNCKAYNITVIFILIILLILSITLSIGIGYSKISFSSIVSFLLSNGDSSSKEYQIINYVRIPRTLAATFVGCALSVSGLILQSILNNPLASPSIVGVNSGAGLFAILIVAFFPSYLGFISIATFIGALIATFLVYFIAKRTRASKTSIVLSGVAVSSFLNAIIDTILIIKPDSAMSRTYFLIGGFSGVTVADLRLPVLFIVISVVIALGFGYDMNILSLGDETAKSLGLNVVRYRFLLIVVASLLAGSAISIAGLIGFVGLIVPHIGRFIVGYNNRILIPVCALLGSIFTLFCDLLARTLFAPFEIPVGIVMSFLGGPFFIYLLSKQKRGFIDA